MVIERRRRYKHEYYEPTIYKLVTSKLYLRPAMPYIVALDRGRIMMTLDRYLFNGCRLSPQTYLKDSQLASAYSQVLTALEDHFVLGSVDHHSDEDLYCWILRFLSHLDNVDVDEIDPDRVEDIIEQAEDALADQFSIYPVDYEPTGYEYLELRRSNYLLEVRCLGDRRIMMYHGDIPEKKGEKDGAGYHRRASAIQLPLHDVSEESSYD